MLKSTLKSKTKPKTMLKSALKTKIKPTTMLKSALKSKIKTANVSVATVAGGDGGWRRLWSPEAEE